MYCVPVVYLAQGEVETERGWEGRKEGRRERGGREEGGREEGEREEGRKGGGKEGGGREGRGKEERKGGRREGRRKEGGGREEGERAEGRRRVGRREGGRGEEGIVANLLKLWNFHNFRSSSVLKMSIYFCRLPNVQYLSDYISVWLLERRSEGVTTSKASFTRCDTSGLHLRPLGLRVSPGSQSSSCPETKRISPKDGPTPAAWWRSRVR